MCQSSFVIISTILGSLLTISSFVFQSKAFAASCITWAEYSRDLPRQGGRGSQWKAVGTLPSEFQNGCILLQNNNSLDIAYVLKIGISPALYTDRRSNSYQRIPAFRSEQADNLDGLVNQGKAIQVTWLTPTNSSLPYLRSIPRNTAFLREDGMTCRSTVCIKSGALSHEELARLLTSVLPASGNPILPGRCHMGSCWEHLFLEKTSLERGRDGILYEVELAVRTWPMNSERPAAFQPSETRYVYCSRTRPAYIFATDGKSLAHLLNPGGDWYGYNQSDYPIYWATCHNFVGPDFFSDKMTNRARQLGYPLNLPSNQIEINNPRDILN